MTDTHKELAGWLLLVACAGMAAQQVPAPVPAPAARKIPAAQTSPVADAERKRQLAHIYQDYGWLEEAKKRLEEILSQDPQNLQAQADLKKILQAENDFATARQALRLEEAEWYLRNGERSKAIELVQNVADSARDGKMMAQAQEAMRRASTLTPQYVLDRLWGSWLLDGMFAIAFVALLALLLSVGRRVWTASYIFVFRRRSRPTWRVHAVNDLTKMGIADLVMAELYRLSSERSLAPALSTGLLKVGNVLLPHPLNSPSFEQGPAVTLVESASAVQLKIGGFELGGLAKMLSGLSTWFNARLPSLTGGAFLSPDTPPRLTVWLTCYGPDRKITSVRESAAIEPNSHAARTSAEGAAFRMYYLLTYPDSTESDTDAWMAVRRGHALLQAYMDGKDGPSLERARQSFAEAHTAVPTLWEAYMCEGIALDLLERHEEAAQRFEYVASHAEGEVREQALYSQAIGHLRRYRPEHLKTAARLCDDVISAGVGIIRLLAQVAKANVIAHYPIFWESLLHDRKAAGDEERKAWKTDDFGKVREWVDQVDEITRQVDASMRAIREVPGRNRDARALQQIEWGKLNARGNVHLNVADRFLEPPLPAELTDAPAVQERFLTSALDAFKTCEHLLPPGVETLTNIGTTYLFLGRYSEARTYLDRAIALNPNYEYAYYRRVHSWDRENQPEKAREALAAHIKPVRIREFKELFAKYGVPLPS